MVHFIASRSARGSGGRAWIGLLLSMVGAALVACNDGGPLDNSSSDPQLTAASIRTVERRGPSWAVNRSDPFACFTSQAARNGPIAYLYRRQRQEFPASIVSSARSVEPLSYRVLDQHGTVLWVLNCTIPASMRARAIVAERFGLWRNEPNPGIRLSAGCVGSEAGCPLDGVTTKACGPGWMGDWPDCYKVFQVQCGSLDPSCGAYGGGGGDDPGAGTSGGTGPCTGCGPSSPTLTCSSVPRGSETSCSIEANGGLVPITTSWTFTGGGLTRTGTPGALSWGGKAVQSGQVSVRLSTGNTLQAGLVVIGRGWRWQKGLQMFLSHATAPLPIDGFGYEEWRDGSPTRLGWNCTRGGCGSLERVLPDVASNPQAGYEVALVPSGPNSGFWYVTAMNYKMDRETAVNRSILPGAARHLLTDPLQANQCRAAMGLAPGTPVLVNLYDFNSRCVTSNIDGLIAGAYLHEELGSNGTNGHEGRAYSFATQPAYDPYFAAGDLVSTTESDLRNRVVNVVKPIQRDLETLSSDHTFVTGNWSGSVWIWNGTLTGFVQTQTITNV